MAAAASHIMSLNSLLTLENCVDAVADMLQAEGCLGMEDKIARLPPVSWSGQSGSRPQIPLRCLGSVLSLHCGFSQIKDGQVAQHVGSTVFRFCGGPITKTTNETIKRTSGRLVYRRVVSKPPQIGAWERNGPKTGGMNSTKHECRLHQLRGSHG